MAIDPKYYKNYVTIQLDNVPVRHCHLQQPDTEFGGNKWHLQALLDDKLAADMIAQGFKLTDKTEKDGTVTKNILKPKKEVYTRSGALNKQPTVVGPDGITPVTEELGNGTVCNLLLSCKAWTVGGKEVLSAYLESVQVVDMKARPSGFADLTKGDTPF